jgi:hypothetical protein
MKKKRGKYQGRGLVMEWTEGRERGRKERSDKKDRRNKPEVIARMATDD